MGRWRWGWLRRGVPPPSPPRAGAPPPLAVTLLRLQGALQSLVAPGERARARRLLREFGARGGPGPRLQRSLRGGGARGGREEEPEPRPLGMEWPWDSSEGLPLPVHTSVGLVLPRPHWEHWRGQLGFAARLIAGVLDYREQLERRDPPEPWLKAAFGACRVPGPHGDEVLRVHPGAEPPTSIIVSRNGQFFQLELGSLSGPPLVSALEAALGALRGRSGRGGAPPVGLLTGQQRRLWGRVQRLLLRDRLNRAAIGRIRSSLFALSLDSPVVGGAWGRGPGGGARQVLTGGGACANSANRWFDKSLQFIVGQDGTCGVLFDPAVIDGAAVAAMMEHALRFCRHFPLAAAPVTSPPLPPPLRLRFSLGPETAPEVARARRQLDSLAADVDVHCFTHEGFGADVGLSPEALVQVALQAAFYRLHGSLCASCEPTALGPVLPGASDLLRPPPAPCLALARALRDPHVAPLQQVALLRAAVAALCRLKQEVLAGQGPERHLQRLRRAALAGKEPLPRLFLDPAYALANHFRLCSLQVRSLDGYWLLRGPLVPDGYGVGVGLVAPPAPQALPMGLNGAAPQVSSMGLNGAAPQVSSMGLNGAAPQVSSMELNGAAPQVSSMGLNGAASQVSSMGLNVAITSFACCTHTDATRFGGALRGVLDTFRGLLSIQRDPKG